MAEVFGFSKRVSGGGVFAEMHWNSSIVVVEHCDEFEACTERFEVLAKRGNANVLGVFEFGDCSLGDVESAGEFCLTDCLAMAEFVEPDLFERVPSRWLTPRNVRSVSQALRSWSGDGRGRNRPRS